MCKVHTHSNNHNPNNAVAGARELEEVFHIVWYETKIHSYDSRNRYTFEILSHRIIMVSQAEKKKKWRMKRMKRRIVSISRQCIANIIAWIVYLFSLRNDSICHTKSTDERFQFRPSQFHFIFSSVLLRWTLSHNVIDASGDWIHF